MSQDKKPLLETTLQAIEQHVRAGSLKGVRSAQFPSHVFVASLGCQLICQSAFDDEQIELIEAKLRPLLIVCRGNEMHEGIERTLETVLGGS